MTGRLGNKKMNEVYPTYSIVWIDKNTGKRPGNLKRPAVTQNLVINHQLTLVGKILKDNNNNNNNNNNNKQG